MMDITREHYHDNWHISNISDTSLKIMIDTAKSEMKLHEIPDIPPQTDETPISVTEEEIHTLLSGIDTHKATHSADYPSWISKNNSWILCEPIAHIINSIMSTHCFPKLWKKSEIRPINKVKTPTQFKDMRPISLLYHLSKITEKVVAKHLRNDIPQLRHQYAYTPSLGTTDALVKFSTDVSLYLDNKNTITTQALMLDFSKAFDRMRPDYATTKLCQLNVQPSIVNLVKSFLTDRSQCVRYQDHTSSYQPCHIGVPQGTIMGPILWNTFIDDLTPDADFVKYADDTTIYTAISSADALVSNTTAHKATVSLHSNILQKAADYASQWCNDNFMLLNASKSTAMNFTLQKSISIDPVTINGANVQIGNHTKLLGVTYDSHMKFTNHVDNVISKSRSAYHALVNLKKAGVATSGLVLFYQARILSIISYAAPSWYPYIAKYDKDKLERYQRLCLFIILPRLEHYADRLAFLKLEELNVYLDIVCLRYANKILADDHHIFHCYIPGRPSTHSRRTIPPKSRTAHLGKNLFFRYF
jgi:hypothetical protein